MARVALLVRKTEVGPVHNGVADGAVLYALKPLVDVALPDLKPIEYGAVLIAHECDHLQEPVAPLRRRNTDSPITRNRYLLQWMCLQCPEVHQ